MEMLGVNPRGDEALPGFILKKHGHKREVLIHKAQPIEDHGFDGAAHGDKPGLGGVLRRSVQYVANAIFLYHSVWGNNRQVVYNHWKRCNNTRRRSYGYLLGPHHYFGA